MDPLLEGPERSEEGTPLARRASRHGGSERTSGEVPDSPRLPSRHTVAGQRRDHTGFLLPDVNYLDVNVTKTTPSGPSQTAPTAHILGSRFEVWHHRTCREGVVPGDLVTMRASSGHSHSSPCSPGACREHLLQTGLAPCIERETSGHCLRSSRPRGSPTSGASVWRPAGEPAEPGKVRRPPARAERGSGMSGGGPPSTTPTRFKVGT